MKIKAILIACAFSCMSTHAYRKTNREYGYFDLSVGPAFMEDNTFGKQIVEYNLGPIISTSVGLTHDNGLGIGLNYIFTYNSKILDLKASNEIVEPIPKDESTAISTNGIKLDFSYRLNTGTEVSIIFHGGPCVFNTTDQSTIVSKPIVESSETATSTDIVVTDAATGTNTVKVKLGDAALPEAIAVEESIKPYSNFTFGYEVCTGIEYRQDRHKAFGIEFGLLSTQVYKSTFSTDAVIGDRITSQRSDTLESIFFNVTARYYM
ncbi:hypothetical protein MMH89_01365 [Candidatus Comchoanobacter bicostacola]|uniref:Outer membrane protein beta-barrel domain-containing protein n=1 Tax=Candidatus Comchoanobacter bicostacola TaxID=2919598 RepID=A0ABY5DKY2_9GAMM|nr:hypothetical protein [Candidatus Comchoanobacter bicostacola]UTC24800.1 hypothetical protein MMH89_01365 [Candidatus Comchoanobacter bicostacola]